MPALLILQHVKAIGIFLLLSSVLCGTARAQGRIVAQITNIRNDKGVCRVCLFDKADAFKGKEGTPLQCREVGIRNGRAEAVFTDLPQGNYAVFAFHDANNNNKFDTNFLGIPKEGYGASRNHLPFAAAPGFEDNKVFLPAGHEVRLAMRFRNL
ncbi:MAG: DUF2141 domain-containing protein [Chitinophagaceae bacterium]|nr:MAG: DUF2141 domain-containing protein [Chitinophagaceae bacterium]